MQERGQKGGVEKQAGEVEDLLVDLHRECRRRRGGDWEVGRVRRGYSGRSSGKNRKHG